MDIRKNFPTSYYKRKRIAQEPASENETKALIRIFQEYDSKGLLSFCQSEKKIVYYRQPQSFAYNQKSYHLARYLQKQTDYRIEKSPSGHENTHGNKRKSTGTPEQFYAEMMKQPAFLIETSDGDGYEAVGVMPLEYICYFAS
jgi:g-D-glutamyl-meso-diaminopimelate peptidase